MTAHVRKIATPEHAEEARQLIQQLVKAVLCLSDAHRKREYDLSLKRPDPGIVKRRTMEQALLAQNAIDPDELTKARNFAVSVGIELRDALIQRKLASADVVMLAYAESVGLPYLELADISVDEALSQQMPPLLARKNSCVPLMIDDNQLLVASPLPLAPQAAEELYLKFGMPVRTVLCTPSDINRGQTRCSRQVRN
jgi:hypothetical protein